MVIEHSFMNYSYATKIYIHIYICMHKCICIYIYIIALPYLINVLSTLMPDISTLIKHIYLYTRYDVLLYNLYQKQCSIQRALI